MTRHVGFLCILAVGLVCTSQAFAAPLLAPGSLVSYIFMGSGGGDINGLNFYDFSYSGTGAGGATPVTAPAITLIPITTLGNEWLLFNGLWDTQRVKAWTP